MLIHLNQIRKLTILSVCFTFSVMGCYKSTEGCLDQLAANYDVSSDDACEDCCTYPNVKLSLNHLWENAAFKFGDTLVNNLGNEIVFLNQKMYFSQFNYTLEDGTLIDNLDSITLTINNDSLSYEKDLALILKTQSSAVLHTYRSEGILKSITFTLGMPDKFNAIGEMEANKYSPLDFSNDTRTNLSYYTVGMTLITGSDLTDTFTYIIPLDYEFKFDKSIEIKKGRDINLPININYDIWLFDIDFINETKETIVAKLIENTTKSIK